MLEPGLKARVTSKARIWTGPTVYRWFFGRFFVSMGLVPIGQQSQGSTRTQRVPNHDVGLSPSDDDRMVACLIESHARRKASERATRILRPSQNLRACHPISDHRVKCQPPFERIASKLIFGWHALIRRFAIKAVEHKLSGGNCRNHCKVQCDSTRMLAHLG